MTLTEVYLVPELSKNTMSYGKLDRKGFWTRMRWHDACTFETQQWRSRV